jgi:hypothetical protein
MAYRPDRRNVGLKSARSLTAAATSICDVCSSPRSDNPGTSKRDQFTRDEAFLIAVNIAKLPSVPRQILKDIPRPPNTASRDD